MSTITPTGDSFVRDATDEPPAAWAGFVSGPWQDGIDVRDFIQRNYTPYAGDDAFLAGPTARTHAGLGTPSRDVPASSASRASTTSTCTRPPAITAHAPGYIDRDDEIIVGLQTDAPLKRAIMPNGGWRMVEGALETYGYEVDQTLEDRLHRVPQDAQRRRLRRLPARGPGGRAARTSSPACRTPTAAAGSSATTAASRSTASTHSSPPRSATSSTSTRRPFDDEIAATARSTPSRSARWPS